MRWARRVAIVIGGCLAALVAMCSWAGGAMACSTDNPQPSQTEGLLPGTLDTDFGTGGFADYGMPKTIGALAAVVQPNGQIITADTASVPNGLTKMNEIVATRLNTDGSLDCTFGDNGVEPLPINTGSLTNSGAAMTLTPDGNSVIIVGEANFHPQGHTTGYQLMFTAIELDLTTGQPVASFGNSGIPGVAEVQIGSSAIAYAVGIEPQTGNIVLGGAATPSAGAKGQFAVAELTATGQLASFGVSGPGYTTFPGSKNYPGGAAWGMAILPNGGADGPIVLGGQDNNMHNYLAAEVTPQGGYATGFGQASTPGMSTIPIQGTTVLGVTLAYQPGTGELVLGGNASATTACGTGRAPVLVRITTSGIPDQSFGNGGVATVCADTRALTAMAIDSADGIVADGGGAYVLRFNENGSPSESFEGTGPTVCGTSPVAGCALATEPMSNIYSANGVALQPDGKIVVAGAVQFTPGVDEQSITRIMGCSASLDNCPG